MNRPPIRAVTRALLLTALLSSLLFSASAQTAAPKRVLILHSFGRDFAPYNAIGSALRTDLTRLLGQPVAFHEASLDVERGGEPEDERPFAEYLIRRSGAAPPDLVVAIAIPATLFCLRHRDSLFPNRPLLVTGVDQRRLKGVNLGVRDRAVTVNLDFPAVARNIFTLQPETTTLALVLGTSQLEQFWTKEIVRDLAPLTERLRVLTPDGLSLEEMRRRVAALPPQSAVFYYMFAVGADGAQHENELALSAIRASSSAPVFGMFADQLGKGIVGGSLLDTREIGSVTARLAVHMLGGEPAVGNVAVSVRTPAFDWRELQRWGIPESRLPPGAEVHFKPPSLWDQHKLSILTGVSIVILQSALIAALLVQRARRRRAENAAVDLSGRLLSAHEDERRRLARELHDDLTQRLAGLAIDAGHLEPTAGAPASAMREELARLSEDVHSLSYRLHPSILDDLGLVEALRVECDRVARRDDVRVEIDAHAMPERVSGDASLCVFRVAQEALSNAVRHGRASAVTVLLSTRDRGLQLAVSDNGSGFDLARSRQHPSLGLASMRERVRLLSGELDIESTPGRGTTVVAWVPSLIA